jgi:hypothetical protein
MAIIEAVRLRARGWKIAGRMLAGLGCVLAIGLATTAVPQQPAPGTAEGRLRVEILDHATGQPVNARCYLTDAANKFWAPEDAPQYHKPPEEHFIAAGKFEISLPAGHYKLQVERGPEYRAAVRAFEIAPGAMRQEKIELERWINMNARGWYSGDLHNHRPWREMPVLLLAEDLNLAPTLTQWVWENDMNATAPPASEAGPAVHVVDATHAFSVYDTEIERLKDGPGAVDLVGLRTPLEFHGYLVSPPNTVFAQEARRQGGYVDAEKITWRDAAALVALGEVDFGGLVYNHFNRHGVETETGPWGMIPKENPEYETPAGMARWAMSVYYRFLNCGFRLTASAGSASGVKPSPLGFERVYVHLPGEFGYAEWFRALKQGRNFATNGPMLFLTVNGREPGDTIRLSGPAGSAPSQARKLKVHVEASSLGPLDRVEVVWKGKVVESISPHYDLTHAVAECEVDLNETGWVAARAFEKPAASIGFAHTSPVYVQVGSGRGIVPEDAKFFLDWIDREMKFYEGYSGFRSEQDRQAMLEMYRKARAVYEPLAKP